MTDKQVQRYVDLVLFCLGGIAGKNLVIRSEVVHRSFVLALARAAYRNGARIVDVAYNDPGLDRARIAYGTAESAELWPAYAHARYEEYARSEWAMVRLLGDEDPDALSGLDSAKVGAFARSRRSIQRPLFQTMVTAAKAWVGVLLPTDGIARKAFPTLSRVEARSRYEDAMVDVLALNEPDPVSIWRGTFAGLAVRRDRYNATRIDSLHFTGPGTDLEIGLHDSGMWATAEIILPTGEKVCENLPSLEVFTTPDFRRTNGRVSATRPFASASVPGEIVEGAWFEFKDGAVVDFGATRGRNTLDAVLNMDAQARYLGEVALVDRTSAVARTGVTFHEVLYDENAASHIALGAGFPNLVNGCTDLSEAELLERGINDSLVHDDIMIGGEGIDVVATTKDGKTVPVMQDGTFVY